MSLKLSDKLRAKQKVELEFIDFQDKSTFDGKETIYTFSLAEPISKVGSTLYDDLSTGRRGIAPAVTDAMSVKVSAADLDFASEDFVTTGSVEDNDFKIVGYKGDKLVLDVSKPRFNNLTGDLKQPCALWLKQHRFSETPRVTINSVKSMDNQRTPGGNDAGQP